MYIRRREFGQREKNISSKMQIFLDNCLSLHEYSLNMPFM